MKQPKVRLFDQTWDVLRLEFDEETGKLGSIVYKEFHGWTRLVVQSEYVDYGRGSVKLDKPVVHPHENYVIVPSFEDVLITE